ncbi:hypothetical protein NEF87_001938 [Candidatus Lokiarchaeum ossiferum]|uniref:Uncharacterized protein n=1 Tax=Candidatus Lokiarchaeum ossiferum TaxID=2951803 RepID=A0ABY6HQ63_9ARCH|nr:hypothetical protein NEF87_001938 [Candidatus Lokiarchaeum sp. B-35]
MENEKKTKFTSQIDEKNREFDTLLQKFSAVVDPVDRYIKRLKLQELRSWLSQYGVEKIVP